MKFISSETHRAYRYESNNYVGKCKIATVIYATDERHILCQESQKQGNLTNSRRSRGLLKKVAIELRAKE